MARRRIRKSGVVGAAIAVAALGCQVAFGPQLQGTGVAKTEQRQIDEFSEIELEGAVELELAVGPAPSIEVSTDDNILPHVVTEVLGDRLRIFVNASYSTNLGVRVKATVPQLTRLEATGATACNVTGASGKAFRLVLAGASHGEFEINVDQLNVELSGASNATLEGAARQLTVDCSGASRLEATDFPAERVEIVASGASTVRVAAAEALTAAASGASTVRYRGEPADVVSDVSGASTIEAE